jgi:hypothetical protein
VVVALVVFAFLASGNLVDSASGMPLGWQRTVALGAARAVDRVANLLSLNRPYDWAAAQLGIADQDEDFEFPAETRPEPPSVTTTTLPPLRVPTAQAPLRLVVAGDSTADALGDRLAVAASDDATLDVDVQGVVATGLTRSDYFNWGQRMQEIVTELDPELVLFMVGANDTQAVLEPDGTVVARYGTPEWEEAYRRRVAGIMDLARGGGRRLVWIGQPSVGDPDVQATVDVVNRLARDEAASRPWVTFFDLAAVVAGEGGGFSEYVTFPDGETVRCYAGDGVHLSMGCLDRAIDGDLLPAVRGLLPEGTDAATVPGPSTSTTAPPP